MYIHENVHLLLPLERVVNTHSECVNSLFRLAWNQRGVHHMKDFPSNVQMGPQRAVAGVGTSKSDVGSSKSIQGHPGK